jgi:hypothetical protein
MNTRQEHGEPERGEGLGGRVRRFVDSEISRVLDKDDRETVRERPDYHRGLANPPVTAAASDPGYTTPAYDYDAPAHDPRAVEEAGTEQLPRRSHDEAVADGSAERVGLLNDPAGLRAQWQQVQGTFVDDPRRAVQEASVLVNRTLQEIHENIARGQVGDPTSTEELRVSFQRYREFFQRLLSA